MHSIEIKGVSKKFSRHGRRPIMTSLKSYILYDLWHPRKDTGRDLLWALKDVTLQIEKGTTLGIIGRNGSGKSTLLKLISGILKPDEGAITVQGNIAALIELGAGFHPELSGRENVIINGIILGLSKNQIKAKFDEIVEFAEMGEYIDDPVRTYSSGMYMKLAFSVAIHVVPDILIIDEILAVGDESFQAKCLEKVRDLRKSGKTILLVSHDLNAVEQMCDQVCLLDQGACFKIGEPNSVIATYHQLLHTNAEAVRRTLHYQNVPNRWGNKEMEITAVNFVKSDGTMGNVFRTNEPFAVHIEYIAHKEIEKPMFGVAIHREDGFHVNGTNTKISDFNTSTVKGEGAVEYSIDSLPLLPGRYNFTAAIYNYTGSICYDHWDKHFPFIVLESEKVKGNLGVAYLPCQWRMLKD